MNVDCVRLLSRSRSRHYRGDVLFFTAARTTPADETPALVWPPYLDGRLEEHVLDLGHDELMSPAALGEIGPLVARALAAARTTGA